MTDEKEWKQIAAGCKEVPSRLEEKSCSIIAVFAASMMFIAVPQLIKGCYGSCHYHDVPLRLVRMIELAGRLGIGEKRVYGAGRIVVKPMK